MEEVRTVGAAVSARETRRPKVRRGSRPSEQEQSGGVLDFVLGFSAGEARFLPGIDQCPVPRQARPGIARSACFTGLSALLMRATADDEHDLMRVMLYEAAQSMMRSKKWSWLKAWAMQIARRRGMKKVIVALARRLAVIMHRIWVDGTEFRWTREQATAAA